MTIGVALLGAGAMGRNHARLLHGSERADLRVVVDPDAERAAKLAADAGAAVGGMEEALGCQAAIIASPTETHVDAAVGFLERGVPVLIEKPITTTAAGVRRVLGEAERRGVPVLCGFVERFNPAIATALGLLEEPPIHLVAVRHSPVTPRATASVVWDLLIHDIDLAFLFTTERPDGQVRGTTWRPDGAAVAEVADCTMTFGDGMVATLSSSRVSQRKIRRLSIATASSLVELDLLRADVTIYRHVRQEQMVAADSTYRAETIVDIPFVRHAGEPLALQLDHFLDLVEGEGDPEAERATLLPPHEAAAAVEEATA